MKSRQLPLLFIALLACTASACKKSKNTTINRKILTIADSSSHSHFSSSRFCLVSYYKDSSVSKMVNGDLRTGNASSVLNFFYDAEKFVILNGSSPLGDTVYINSKGLITRSGSISYRTTYTYNSANELIKMTNGNTPSHNTLDYIWSGGNMRQSLYNSAPYYTYEYYEDLPFMPGDGIYMEEFMRFGRCFTLNKNLIKSIKSVWFSRYFYYSFDNHNRISSMSSIQYGSSDTLSWVYNLTY